MRTEVRSNAADFSPHYELILLFVVRTEVRFHAADFSPHYELILQRLIDQTRYDLIIDILQKSF
ncbi:hypothetical protein [Microcoleus sp. PH2017_16_JOR_D_A]|uniref:hypothetical protein n=1 Tax=Microcoleus sp. PH2017_16_JOR_D_A TaxID=2798827 RepID=UPI0025EA6451|nr:hypothetical protein [Microcoleus sp. PH2017_16_JOR_D_A]